MKFARRFLAMLPVLLLSCLAPDARAQCATRAARAPPTSTCGTSTAAGRISSCGSTRPMTCAARTGTAAAGTTPATATRSTPHWNAAYLLTYGLADNNSNYSLARHGRLPRHGRGGRQQVPHQPVPHRQRRRLLLRPLHLASVRPLTGCRPCARCTTPVPRAAIRPRALATFAHEGWHAWLDKYDWDNGSCGGHRCGTGNCTATDACDYFYFHGVARQPSARCTRPTAPPTASTRRPTRCRWSSCAMCRLPQGPWVPASVRQGGARR